MKKKKLIRKEELFRLLDEDLEVILDCLRGSEEAVLKAFIDALKDQINRNYE